MKVHTDPESLKRIANAINASTGEIQAAIQKMQGALSAAQWNDPVRTAFDADFANLVNSLKKFQSQAPRTVQYLRKKAAQLEDYQQS